jgi:hypothetical protein
MRVDGFDNSLIIDICLGTCPISTSAADKVVGNKESGCTSACTFDAGLVGCIKLGKKSL